MFLRSNVRKVSLRLLQRPLWGTVRSFSESTQPRLFDKVLIANRGEIACRVIRTCRKLGIRTVAVYSDADADSQHVKLADEARHIGLAPASQSYLLGDKILEVCKETNAQAVHPGYGFLSENHEFAEACKQQGISFIGPPSTAIVSMGSKSESKKIMENANVPCTPGYHGEDQTLETLAAEAHKIGFPVMLKAVMGGGGKGMRMVKDPATLEENILACQREATSSFGDGRILIEKFLEKPRHIELQIFADSFGNVVHLYERDCSVQRRHQKVLEEAPAPLMPEGLRKKMGDAAVNAARAVGYVGAGTVEFMVDATEKTSENSPFYFMEMNTRLQVEHPVTEMVTNLDLVELQLKVASGYSLPFSQEDVSCTGHALEARIYAENPGSGFLPGSGKIKYLNEPDRENVRIDTGIVEGDDVSVHYDPMISKLIVYGQDRDQALKLMASALADYQIAGVTTNIEFCLACVQHDAFAAGGVDTSFIGQYETDLLRTERDISIDSNVAAVAMVVDCLARSSREQGIPFGFRTVGQTERVSTFEIGTDDGSCSRTVKAIGRVSQSLTRTNDLSMEVEVEGGNSVLVEAKDSTRPNVFQVLCNGLPLSVSYARFQDEIFIFSGLRGGSLLPHLSYKVKDLVDNFDGGSATSSGAYTAPMPGKIVKVMVSKGDQVEEGQTMIIMEAMKMEHVIKASRDGVVSAVSVEVDDFVEDSQTLCSLEQAEDV
mmetsp:Transcript_13813/g.18036  ORF Transcript_13813/g.18036 Transcript_13813/m.18036 type:complete len:718 (-) Transcript_13813:409-2562(-)